MSDEVHTTGQYESRGKRKNIYDVYRLDVDPFGKQKSQWTKWYDLRASDIKEAKKIANEEKYKTKVKKADDEDYLESEHYDD